MSISVVLHGDPPGGPGLRYDDATLEAGRGGTYGYHVGSGAS